VTMERDRERETSRVSNPPEETAQQPTVESDRSYGAASVLALQRSIGNQAVHRLLQRAVFKAGGKGVAVSAEAKSVARWVMTKTSVQAGGSNHIADIQGRGFPGFKMYKEEYAGGRVFNNNAQPDNNKLPYIGGQTYQEWDTLPCVAGQGRGADRVVTGSDGKAYYSNDHYANFTEFTP
jgi:guanyl-specific ribonuclease Sa